jgi:hypothetical protein
LFLPLSLFFSLFFLTTGFRAQLASHRALYCVWFRCCWLIAQVRTWCSGHGRKRNDLVHQHTQLGIKNCLLQTYAYIAEGKGQDLSAFDKLDGISPTTSDCSAAFAHALYPFSSFAFSLFSSSFSSSPGYLRYYVDFA